MSATPLLAVRGLSIEFSQAEGWQRVVDGVSFDLARGEVLGMVGESGSGKTVTSRALIRLLPERNCRIAEGRIELEGRDVMSLSAAELGRLRGERVAMIFQNPSSHLDPVMRIGAQIAEGLVLHQGLG
ncbi:MAG: ATP-binding cassette domain-containing protein, partial [Kiloniellales bacterium]|nr:ATP-binding cassette domain-containing protein [Kiloniellales bacterium]